MADVIGGKGDLLDSPGDDAIRKLAAELNTTIYTTCRELARRELGRPAFGTDDWAAEISAADTSERRREVKQEYLTRLRILRTARVDLQRTVLEARKHRLSWRDIGSACGMTRQAAYDRWGAAEKQQEQADEALAEWARKTGGEVAAPSQPGGEPITTRRGRGTSPAPRSRA